MPGLAETIVRLGRLTAAQVQEAMQRAGDGSDEALGAALVGGGLLSEEDLLSLVARQWSLPWAAEVPDDWLDPALVERLPVEWARAHRVMPVRRDGRLHALVGAPDTLAAQEDLALLLGRDLAPLLTTPAEVDRAIERCYFRKPDASRELIRGMEAGTAAAGEPAAGGAAEDLLRMADGAPVAQLVNAVLLGAVKARASDIHVEPFEDHLQIRYRIDGQLYDQPAPPKPLEAPLTSRLKVMARLDIAEKRLPQDGMARVRIGAREIDIRVSTVPVAEGERIVLRLLNRDSALLPLTSLGMGTDMVDEFRRLIRSPQGIVLVTGPTGSGKTTTLYAALRELDTRRLNVLTIEDPIEYQLPSISQMQVNPRIDLTFSRCLRHVLRQDPDVILVGETRDLETAEIAIRASLTGHLVFTTLHTNDAPGAPVRLADMGAEPYLLSASLRGALAQRLVRRLCPHCRREGRLQPADARGLQGGETLVGRPHWTPAGCERCLDGYHGRTGVFELMVVRPALADAIRARADLNELRRIAEADGMRSLRADAAAKMLAGETSLAELQRVVGE